MTLDNSELLNRFEAEYHDRLSTTMRRREAVRAELGKLAALMDGRTLVEATPSDLMAWQGAQKRRGLQTSTVRQREGMIRPFFTWATHAELIPWEASARLQSVPPVPAPHHLPRPYKGHEIAAFREALAARYPLAPTSGPGSQTLRSYLRSRRLNGFYRYAGDHLRHVQLEAAVSLALEEGLRCGEMYDLTLAQMEPDNPAVIVRCAKTRYGYERWREVPYTAHSRQCVSEWLQLRRLIAPPHDRPWLALLGRNQDGAMKKQHFERLLLPIGDGYWSWHRFRHTFATERLRAGMPLEKLQVMLGHARLDTTLGYAEILHTDVAKEAARTEDAFARALGLIA